MHHWWSSAFTSITFVIRLNDVAHIQFQFSKITFLCCFYAWSSLICHFVFFVGTTPIDWTATIVSIVDWDAALSNASHASQWYSTVNFLATGIFFDRFVLKVFAANASVTSIFWIHFLSLAVGLSFEFTFWKLFDFRFFCNEENN